MNIQRPGTLRTAILVMSVCAGIGTGLGRAMGEVAPAAPVLATDHESEGPAVVVSGRGEVSVAPDRAVISVGVSIQDVTAEQAQAKVNDKMNSMVDALKKANIPAERIQTSRADLFPVYETRQYNDGREPQVVAYRCSNSVRVELDDLKRIGAVLDLAIKTGANQVQGVSFELKNDSEARREALTKAVKDARDKAETIAKALGGSLGDVLEAGEPTVVATPRMQNARMSSMAADVGNAGQSTPVMPGQVQVSATVMVRYGYTKP